MAKKDTKALIAAITAVATAQNKDKRKGNRHCTEVDKGRNGVCVCKR